MTLKLHLAVPRAKKRLGLVHIEKVDRSAVLACQSERKVHGGFRLAGTRLAYKYDIFCFANEFLCHLYLERQKFHALSRRFMKLIIC